MHEFTLRVPEDQIEEVEAVLAANFVRCLECNDFFVDDWEVPSQGRSGYCQDCAAFPEHHVKTT